MKKMTRSSKKGFTLAEIILVVAIIVIVSAASFVGVGAIINNAKNTSKKLEENNGENFEAEAWGEVKSITRGAADFFDIPYYTPEDGEGEDGGEGEEPETTEPGGGWASGGSGGGGGGGTPASEPSFRPTATPVPTATPTPKPAGGSGKNAPGSNVTIDTNNWWGSQLTFDKPITKCVVVTDGTGLQVNANGMYQATDIGGGKYRVEFTAKDWGSPITSIPFHVDNATTCYIESFE